MTTFRKKGEGGQFTCNMLFFIENRRISSICYSIIVALLEHTIFDWNWCWCYPSKHQERYAARPSIKQSGFNDTPDRTDHEIVFMQNLYLIRTRTTARFCVRKSRIEGMPRSLISSSSNISMNLIKTPKSQNIAYEAWWLNLSGKHPKEAWSVSCYLPFSPSEWTPIESPLRLSRHPLPSFINFIKIYFLISSSTCPLARHYSPLPPSPSGPQMKVSAKATPWLGRLLC
jgi:hypothetical protein